MKRYLLVTALILISCSFKEAPGRLDRGILFVEHHLSESYIRENTVFLDIKGEHTVEEWVPFFFSAYSTGAWLTETNEFDMVPVSQPYIPDSVTILREGDTLSIANRGYYLVTVAPNSSNSTVVVKGYKRDSLVTTEIIPFPKFE